MDDTVASEDVHGDNAGVEVDSQATRTNVGAETLGKRTITELVGDEQSWDSASNKDTAGGVETGSSVSFKIAI